MPHRSPTSVGLGSAESYPFTSSEGPKKISRPQATGKGSTLKTPREQFSLYLRRQTELLISVAEEQNFSEFASNLRAACDKLPQGEFRKGQRVRTHPSYVGIEFEGTVDGVTQTGRIRVIDATARTRTFEAYNLEAID